MIKKLFYNSAVFLYFILFYSVVILAYLFEGTALGKWFKRKVQVLAPE